MLTARGEETERVRGLATGADDYIVKPFSVPELLARIRALLRRARPERVAGCSPPATSNSTARRSACRARPRRSTGPTEFRLLEFLMENPGRVFSREQLLDRVWGSDVYIDERTVDVHVGRLRKALNRGRATDPIRTVRGAGYSLNDRFVKDERVVKRRSSGQGRAPPQGGLNTRSLTVYRCGRLSRRRSLAGW